MQHNLFRTTVKKYRKSRSDGLLPWAFGVEIFGGKISEFRVPFYSSLAVFNLPSSRTDPRPQRGPPTIIVLPFSFIIPIKRINRTENVFGRSKATKLQKIQFITAGNYAQIELKLYARTPFYSRSIVSILFFDGIARMV